MCLFKQGGDIVKLNCTASKLTLIVVLSRT